MNSKLLVTSTRKKVFEGEWTKSGNRNSANVEIEQTPSDRWSKSWVLHVPAVLSLPAFEALVYAQNVGILGREKFAPHPPVKS